MEEAIVRNRLLIESNERLRAYVEDIKHGASGWSKVIELENRLLATEAERDALLAVVRAVATLYPDTRNAPIPGFGAAGCVFCGSKDQEALLVHPPIHRVRHRNDCPVTAARALVAAHDAAPHD